MPSIFLSYANIDKPFVEKLARDLKRIGVDVWFDKWKMKVGDSRIWETEDGIRENEYLGLVLTPEALESEWVKSDLEAAWVKQMQTKKVFVLPILYRDCQIPLFLADRKFADFRNEYEDGFNEIAALFGIKDTEAITQDNWRKFTKKRNVNWKAFKIREFEEVVTSLVDKAISNNWSVWVGGTANEFSLTLSAYTKQTSKSVSIKLVGNRNAYMATFKPEYNPNNLKVSDFDIYVGNSVNACEGFVWRVMRDFNETYGKPVRKATYFTERFSRGNEITEAAKEMIKRFNWYKGDNIPR
ncbi:toll/interleukin-1 receptor domain-containing protein [Tumebacillus lipolyticus]|uniref:Toll/interleukin-1 receptor domain-containing protein n=1 Tax=Tumebacillus lipolyticus TaxID=1280370 RepID=A0ABW4ZYY4_9BACL